MTSIEKTRTSMMLLIVEDNEDALAMLSLLIVKRFPTVSIRTSCDGTKGVALCREFLPDIVVTDISMAGMDGVQMAGHIRALKTDTRFIVTTGHSDKEYLDKFGYLGASAYLVKPINFKKLFAAIEGCIDEIHRGGAKVDGC